MFWIYEKNTICQYSEWNKIDGFRSGNGLVENIVMMGGGGLPTHPC